MKEKYVGMFWGLVLILVGGWFLISGNPRFVIRDYYLGLAFNAGLSAAFFISYFLSGPRRWGWLFPACIFAGTSITMTLGQIPGAAGAWIGAPVLLSVAVPFLVAYLQEPQKRRWALIPVYVMVGIALITMVVDQIHGEYVGTIVLLGVALPFLVAYLRNPERKWPLIPFGILAVLSIIPALSANISGSTMGLVTLLLFTVSFGVVFLLNRRQWWALIPTGIFATLAVTVLLTLTLVEGNSDPNQLAGRIVGGVLFLGWALTFFCLWLYRGTYNTSWAIYPALPLAILAAASFIGGDRGLTIVWPLAVIAGGVSILFRNSRKTLA